MNYLAKSQKQESELEVEKLKEEIRHLKRPLIGDPQFLGPLATILVAISTLIIGGLTYGSGILDFKKIDCRRRPLKNYKKK